MFLHGKGCYMKTSEKQELIVTIQRIQVLAKLLTMCGYGKVTFTCKEGKEKKK